MLWILTLPPVAAAIKIADIRLAHDGDFGSLVFHRFVTTGRSSGRDSQNSSDNKLLNASFRYYSKQKKY
jgi:hypothetical protein